MNEKPRITVLLVDDHAVVREGYRRLLEMSAEIEVVGETGNSAEAYKLAYALKPAVVVMDISLPDVSGIETARHEHRAGAIDDLPPFGAVVARLRGTIDEHGFGHLNTLCQGRGYCR